ncbi:class I SAM-dependent methyltransferase [Frankia sp. AgB32]|uniref:class I SAM-dependent methyltransferase n=1 Tax=Frankia sp. AgB32 TaxID=631119 RepID=UPI00200FEBB6|nr:class I SAM-dependent methyltransferase [Frankia sp. AgB32]MCK9897880.1 methyltransferase domain-containing protein [Frankia sp. AgB32]
MLQPPGDGTRRSYDPQAMVAGYPGELRRLEAQAALSWADELRALRRLGLTDGMRVLDVGGGSGTITRRLAEILPTSDIVMVDQDPALLAEARRILAPFGTRVIVLQGTAEQLPQTACGVDFALARLVLQHVADPVAVAREVRDALRPGGTFAVLDVDGGMWGVAEPYFPETAAFHARAWMAQSTRGGDRFIGRKLWSVLRHAGFQEVTLDLVVSHSGDSGLGPFLAVIDPLELQPMVADGVLSLTEFAAMTAAYRRFVTSAESFLLTVGFLAAGRVPGHGRIPEKRGMPAAR